MTPAQRRLNPAPTETTRDVVARIAGSLVTQPATITTSSGRYVTAGVAEFSGSPGQWSATVRQLDRPGVMASMYFADGLRDVIIELHDGRRARARITGTSFIASSQRLCHLEGIERLA